MLISSPCPLSHVLAYHNEQTVWFGRRLLNYLSIYSRTEGQTEGWMDGWMLWIRTDQINI